MSTTSVVQCSDHKDIGHVKYSLSFHMSEDEWKQRKCVRSAFLYLHVFVCGIISSWTQLEGVAPLNCALPPQVWVEF